MNEKKFITLLKQARRFKEDIKPSETDSKREIVAEQEEKRWNEFADTCEQKLKPIFRQIIDHYLKDQEYELQIQKKTIDGFDVFSISLNWEVSEEQKKHSKFPFIIPRQVKIKDFLDALTGDQAKLKKDAYIIAELSHVESKKYGNHLRPSFVKTVTLKGQGGQNWEAKLKQEILRQLGVYTTLMN